MADKVLTIDINENEINSCKPLDPKNYNPTDCAINVMDLFKIIHNDIALDLSKLKNITGKGTEIPEITYYLSRKLPSYDLTTDVIYDKTDIDTNPPFKSFLFTELEINKGIIALFRGSRAMGHAVIIAKDKNNQLYIIDQQTHTMTKINKIDDLMNYMNKYRFNELITFFYKKKTPVIKDKIINLLLEPTVQLRKNKSKKIKKENDFKRAQSKRKRSKSSSNNKIIRKAKSEAVKSKSEAVKAKSEAVKAKSDDVDSLIKNMQNLKISNSAKAKSDDVDSLIKNMQNLKISNSSGV